MYWQSDPTGAQSFTPFVQLSTAAMRNSKLLLLGKAMKERKKELRLQMVPDPV